MRIRARDTAARTKSGHPVRRDGSTQDRDTARTSPCAGGFGTAQVPVVVRHDEVVTHVPVASAERARALAAAHEADLLISVGGGSTTDLAKAIALTSGLPVVAVPTTYAGSEATSVWGLTEGPHKTTGVDARVLPRSIVYDATLTLSLPVAMSVASGLNALAHCVNSMQAPRTDPVDQALATEGLQQLRHAVDAPTALHDYGFKETDIDDAVPAVLEAVPAEEVPFRAVVPQPRPSRPEVGPGRPR